MEIDPRITQIAGDTIPKGWGYKPLGEIAPLQRGFDLPLGKIKPGINPVVYSNGIMNYHKIGPVQPPGVVTGRSGTIGKVFFLELGYWPHNTTLWVTNFFENYPKFIFYLYEFLHLEKFSTGSGVPTLNRNDVHDYKTVIPPEKEQHAIAEALSDVDALIISLDALITKKRAIKQGVMQELLTGIRRLPGFNMEWEKVQLGDIAKIKTGKKNNDDKVDDGEYPFFVRSQTIEKINSFSFEGEAILIPGEGGIGSIYHYIVGRFDYHQRVYKISDFQPDVFGKFVYYVMTQKFNDHAMRNTVKATVDSLRLPTFQKFEFVIPNNFREQKEIVEVITDMDYEIRTLENKRDKTKALKQGMMQELLTGRIRIHGDNQ